MLRIFGMLSLKIGYRILNCIISLWSFIFGFYLSLGIRQILLKVIFVSVIVSTAHSYLDFILIGSHLLWVSALSLLDFISSEAREGVMRHN